MTSLIQKINEIVKFQSGRILNLARNKLRGLRDSILKLTNILQRMSKAKASQEKIGVFTSNFLKKIERLNFFLNWNNISILILLPYLNIINSILKMWDSQFLDLESHNNIQLLQMAQPMSPPEFQSLIVQQKTYIGIPQLLEEQKDPYDSYSSSQNQNQGRADRPAQDSRLRKEWTYEQQLLFFKFLGKYMIKYPNQFLSWKKGNKRGIFREMKDVINRSRHQCRLKFRTYKRKHSDRKDKANYETCMREVIIRRLKEFAKADDESRFILKKLNVEEYQISGKEKVVVNHIEKIQKHQNAIQDIFSCMISSVQKNQVKIKIQEDQISNKKMKRPNKKSECEIKSILKVLQEQNCILKQEQTLVKLEQITLQRRAKRRG